MNEEGFQVELFKLNDPILVSFLPVLFNSVVCTGFLDSWLRHTIYLILKTILTLDLGSYKTIMIGDTFAKLFATSLNIILSSELDKRVCRARSQASFWADY